MRYFDYMKPWKWGKDLTAEQQRQVLNMYVHRYTGTHKPEWANKEWKDGKPYPLQFKDDSEWLEHTRFQTRKNGTLVNCDECQSHPTWPNNPELRKGGDNA